MARFQDQGRLTFTTDVHLFEDVDIDLKDVTIDQVRDTEDGYFVASPRVARTGIQVYKGREVGRDELSVVRIYRPPSEVFNKDSLHSYTGRPLTNDHPSTPVTAANWKKFAIGQTGEDVLRDGDFIRVPMVLMDAEVIKLVKDGKRALSLGYSTDLKWEAGVTDSGEAYDAIQTNIRANHLAVVNAARGGPMLRIGDHNETTELKMNIKTIVVDGIDCQVVDTSASVIQRHLQKLEEANDGLKSDVTDAKKALTDLQTAQAASVTKAKTDIDTKDAEIATLKKQLEDAKLSPEKLDQLVHDRAQVMAKARAILGDKLVIDKKTDGEIRRQVVDAELGDVAKGWNDEQIAASFNTLTAKVKNDDNGSSNVLDVARSFSGGNTGGNDARSKAYDAYEADLGNAWQRKEDRPRTQ
jgi:hypothetical protein